ncbi:unnamed protein product [Penicillium olsonii]|uniref:Uncharacterized protein n=1 Tax=Penicillium olsonii TaxID=99116 RepID=A0A9W4IKB5_PENOL|nr:unnamed protein product [Penicillium olsonii]CAG8302539.1 unnamed protein product [Penicillium olsonii]
MAEHAAKQGVNTPQYMPTPATWYAWYLVCETFHPTGKKDLASLCLVSKAMKNLASPFLYRSITVEICGDHLVEDRRGLIQRLFHKSNESPRGLVQEIIVKCYDEGDFEKVGSRTLSKLLKRLEHLRRVKFEMPCDFKRSYVTRIEAHPNKPELQLLKQDSLSVCPRSIPAVTVLNLEDEVFCRLSQGSFLNHLTSFPNLTSCAWAPNCLPDKPDANKTASSCASSELEAQFTFPPIQHLALDRYFLDSEMSPGLLDRFQWPKVTSLELGSDWETACANLRLLTGRMINLRRLKITRNGPQKYAEPCAALEEFLKSFDTLIDLELIGCFVPFDAIARHTWLVSLIVHTPEAWNGNYPRNMAETMDLISLDACCPRLEHLKLDAERNPETGEWPWEFIDTLASGFSTMRTLVLNFRLGNGGVPIRREHDPAFLEPYLTTKEATAIGCRFYANRHRVFNRDQKSLNIGMGNLQRLTLTNANKNPRMRPRATYHARSSWLNISFPNTSTFGIVPPITVGDMPGVIHVERQEAEKLHWMHPPRAGLLTLEHIIRCGEEGPLDLNPYGRSRGKTCNRARRSRPIRQSARLAAMRGES